MHRKFIWLLVPILAVFLIEVAFFHRFYADDALIACRYAENLVDFGQLVYNKGEYITSLTSPLHALIEALLYQLSGHTLLAWQVTALILLIISTCLVLRRFHTCPYSQIVALAVLFISPCVVLWSFGGLETNLLLFFITLLALAAFTPATMTSKRLHLVMFLAGVCFVTRYDSCLFSGPVVLAAAWKNRRPHAIAQAALLGAVLPAAWLLFSKLYYGDIFPTSFYVKPITLHPEYPSVFFSMLWKNGSYILQYLVIIGFVPLFIFRLVAGEEKLPCMASLRRCFLAGPGIFVGLLLVVAYGLAVATVPMMFSFRFFIPYMPALVILLADLYTDLSSYTVPASSIRVPRRFAVFVLMIVLFQLCQAWYTWAHAMNGAVIRLSDYDYTYGLGVRDHLVVLDNLRKQADDLKSHWAGMPNRPSRPPRIWTFAGGTTPYYCRDAYVFERLASYRHNCHPELKPSADYIQILPLKGVDWLSVLPPDSDSYRLVASYISPYYHTVRTLLLYYNPHPLDNPLPPRVDGVCAEGVTRTDSAGLKMAVTDTGGSQREASQ